MRIGVFLRGTAIMHAAGADVGQAERVRQRRQRSLEPGRSKMTAG
jgi:hypothetical protein